ncbi:MAG TPA: ACP phosphodiesterase [Chitinophagaceae bacterium]|jgi:acyl carrier protein phosphodiesterase|nr:ACP phosphodiesterase [Chitinophagaceae bacterium]
MISDFVKGKKKFDYPPGIQNGIALHRAIDEFTDTHEATREAKEVFRSDYRLYSGAFVDVVYDHFLANDAAEFTEASLLDFSVSVYTSLEKQSPWFPEQFAVMFPYMKQHNWLYNYRTRRGTGKSLGGVVRRSVYLTESDTAFHLFEQHYQLLQDCFRHFWAFVKPFALQRLELLQKGSETADPE